MEAATGRGISALLLLFLLRCMGMTHPHCGLCTEAVQRFSEASRQLELLIQSLRQLQPATAQEKLQQVETMACTIVFLCTMPPARELHFTGFSAYGNLSMRWPPSICFAETIQ